MILSDQNKDNNSIKKELYPILREIACRQLKNDIGKKYVTFSLHKGESDILASKIGGIPFIPQGGEYPVHKENGERLHFLIQLNFAEIPHIEGYPESGILQFFISDDKNYGVNWDNPQCQNSWRTRYYKDISNPMPLEAVKKMMPVVDKNSSCLPFEMPGQAFTLEFTEEVMPISPDESTSCLGGYSGVEGLPKDYQLLLRINSEKGEQGCYLKWGDYGVVNFFIHPDDLRKCDFSKVFFSWDCY